MRQLLLITIIGITCIAASNSDRHHDNSSEVIKKLALSVLQEKCNVCHINQNRNRVFTYENMDRFSKKINRQVFKWKRMPKGNEIKLTESEKTQLKNWLNSLNKK